MREGSYKPQKFVCTKAGKRLMSFGVRPPKIAGSSRSVPVMLGSFWISRCLGPGAVTVNVSIKRSKRVGGKGVRKSTVPEGEMDC